MKLLVSNNKNNSDVRKDLQRKQQIFIAYQFFPISPLPPLDPGKIHFFIILSIFIS